MKTKSKNKHIGSDVTKFLGTKLKNKSFREKFEKQRAKVAKKNKKAKKWKPKIDDVFWYICIGDEHNYPCSATISFDTWTRWYNLYQPTLGVYRTKAAAEKALKKIKAFVKTLENE